MSTTASSKTTVTILEDVFLSGTLALATNDIDVGQRLAALRKERGITQVELAELLDVTQSMVSDYEKGIIRLHGEVIVQLTKILRVSADELLGIKGTSKKNGAIKNRRLSRRIQAIDDLPKRDQEALLRTIDAFISKSA